MSMNQYLELGIHTKIAFPSFSEKVFFKREVRNACLALRDKYQLNSNILLFCCWLASQNCLNLTEDDIQRIVRKTKTWDERIVQGLRELRKKINKQYLNDSYAMLYKIARENELFAEKVEQVLIEQAMGSTKANPNSREKKVSIALKNIFSYIKSQQINIHKVDLEKIYTIVGVCFNH